MGAKKGGQHRKQRERGKRRSAVAAAGAMLLVPAVVAGEPAPWLAPVDEIALAGHAGGGLPVLDDPATLGADGSKPANEKIGPQILALAGKPDLLALTAGPTTGFPRGPLGIPGNMLTAYMRAAQTLAADTPNCKLQWSLLASIGRIESGHARGGQADANGDTLRRILGPELNGAGPVAAIADTDGGAYDGNTVWDHAVGPMQFIPSTWAGYASDGNGDGQTDPNNIFDATVGAGRYLCSGGMDLSDPRQRATAIFRYNNSDSYVRTVILWANAYAKGVHPMDPTPVSEIPQPWIPPESSDRAALPSPPSSGNPPSTNPTTTTTPTTTPSGPTTTPSGPTTTDPTTTTPTSTEPTSTEPTTTEPTTTEPTTTAPTTTPPCETTTPPTTPTTTPSVTPTTEPTEPCGSDSETPAPSTPPSGTSSTGSSSTTPSLPATSTAV